MFFFFIFSMFISFVSILFSVMFITLMERKILSYTQNRIGPNKNFFLGILQPVLDGFKLFLKEMSIFWFFNKFTYIFSPMFFMLLMILIWIGFPSKFNFFSFSFSMVFIMICIGLGVYTTLISGWSSNSKFSMIGSIRAMSQTISYEISISILFFSFLSIFSALSILSFLKFKSFIFLCFFFPSFLIWMLSSVAECNRAPFDFAEGESELVSGFNTEYFSSMFAFLFIGEYGMILFFSFFSVFLFFSFNYFFLFFFLVFSTLMIFIRSVYPRFRYDKLMYLAWLKFLPVTSLFLGLSIWEFFFL